MFRLFTRQLSTYVPPNHIGASQFLHILNNSHIILMTAILAGVERSEIICYHQYALSVARKKQLGWIHLETPGRKEGLPQALGTDVYSPRRSLPHR